MQDEHIAKHTFLRIKMQNNTRLADTLLEAKECGLLFLQYFGGAKECGLLVLQYFGGAKECALLLL